MTTMAWSAQADTVMVVKPDGGDAMLTEAFSRLCGELRMYGFTVQLADREGSGPGEVVGGVSLFRAPGQANARIWIADTSTGKRNVGITVSIDDADAPSLLAIRAADLLRASLRDFERSTERERPAVVEPRPAPTAIAAAPARWLVHAGVGALWETGDLGPGMTVHLGAARWISSLFALGLDGVVSATAQNYSVPSGMASAHLREYWGVAAFRWRVVTGGRLSLDAVQGLGAAYLSVRGTAQPPWVGQGTSTWTAVSSTGACLDVALSQHMGLMVSTAVVFLLPRPTLDVADVSYTVRQPLLVTSGGFRYAF
jgi:hypothetical protein